jgi:hypothetical protein
MWRVLQVVIEAITCPASGLIFEVKVRLQNRRRCLREERILR